MVDKKNNRPSLGKSSDRPHASIFYRELALIKIRPANLYIWVLVYLVNQIIIFQNIPLDVIKTSQKLKIQGI